MFRNDGWMIGGVLALMVGVLGTMAAGEPVAPQAAAVATSAATAAAASDTYVGTQKCRMCHMPQARAHSAFTADTTSTTRMVLRAGVTVDSKTLGHESSSPATLYTRSNTGCESCHGMGSRHLSLGASNRDTEARRTSINLPDGNRCRTCHSTHPARS